MEAGKLSQRVLLAGAGWSALEGLACFLGVDKPMLVLVPLCAL
jgi:hypothetical protein